MRKFTKEITALLATAAMSASMGAGTASSEEEIIQTAGVVTVPEEMTTTTTTTTTTIGTETSSYTMTTTTCTIPPYEGTQIYTDTETIPPLTGIETTTCEPPTIGTETTTTLTTTMPPLIGTVVTTTPTTTIPPIMGGATVADGDANGDGSFGVSDAVVLQKYLLNAPNIAISNKDAVDMNYDGEVNVFDLILLKRKLISGNFGSVTISDGYNYEAKYIRTNGNVSDAVYPKKTLVTSYEQLKEYIKDNKDNYDLSGDFASETENYTKEWFSTHNLAIVLLEEGSGSNAHLVTDVTKDSIKIQRLLPQIGTCDVAEWHILIELDKDTPVNPDFDVVIEDVQLTDCLNYEAKYIRTNGYVSNAVYPKKTLVTSYEQLKEYIEANKDTYDLSRTFADETKDYTEEWFNTHNLAVILLEEGSGSNRHFVKDVTKDSITIQRLLPQIGTCDMAEWHILIELDKDNSVNPDFNVVIEKSRVDEDFIE